VPSLRQGFLDIVFNALGLLAALGILAVVIGAGFAVTERTWPIWLLLAGCLCAWDWIRARHGALARLASQTVSNWIWGLAIVFIILLAVNLARPTPSIEALDRFDHGMLALDAWLPQFLKPSWWLLIAVTVMAMAVTWFAPSWRLVSRWLLITKVGERVAAAVSIAASFTVFSHELVVRPHVQSERVQAIYRRHAEDAKRDAARYVVMQAAAPALSTLDASQVARLLHTAQAINGIEPPTVKPRRFVEFSSFDYKVAVAKGAGANAVREARPVTPANPPSQAESGAILEAEARAKMWERAAAEEEKGLKDIVGRVADRAAEPVKSLAWAFLSGMIGAEAAQIADVVRRSSRGLPARPSIASPRPSWSA